MKLVKVDVIHERRVPNQKLQALIKEFINSDAQSVEVIFTEDEYANYNSCRNALNKAIKISGYSGIRVLSKYGHVYMTKNYEE